MTSIILVLIAPSGLPYGIESSSSLPTIDWPDGVLLEEAVGHVDDPKIIGSWTKDGVRTVFVKANWSGEPPQDLAEIQPDIVTERPAREALIAAGFAISCRPTPPKYGPPTIRRRSLYPTVQE